uniref:DDE_Tnp_Tn3 domain-containing protein n=1 Tax=Panagrellus redivivus TaxID=6233 RepID=A0A7E4VV63_PANRE
MAFWGNRLVSTFLLLYHDALEFPELFGDELPGAPNPVLRIKDDYADGTRFLDFVSLAVSLGGNLSCVLRCSRPMSTARHQLENHRRNAAIASAIAAVAGWPGEKIIEKMGVTNLTIRQAPWPNVGFVL